jgi:hypothetical protein
MGFDSCSSSQLYINVTTVDDECGNCFEAVVADIHDSGLTIITPMPLDAGTRISISVGNNFAALGEIIDWEWDVMGDLARLHIRLIEKNSNSSLFILP